jgi:broad specificity phosphatase PhoE
VARGPAELIAVRHGESWANAAFAAADAEDLLDAGITGRDADVPLSPRGRAQAAALGPWLAARVPDAVLCSPYRRAVQTADAALAALDPPLPYRLDERLRDREPGVLELLTAAAVRTRYPAELERRRRVGELYYRPPGGESLADVALRVRSVLHDLADDHPGERVLLVAHDAVVLMLRYVLDGLTEDELYRIAMVRNGTLARWVRHDGVLRLADYDRAP